MARLSIARVFLSCLLAGLALASSLTAQTPPADLNLGNEIRAGIRWVRASQNATDGSYGGGVAGTAWALRALAECPDHYRAVDGPFVRKALDYLSAHRAQDGTIADAAATGQARLDQTRLAAASLALFADETTAEALKAALKALGSNGLAGPAWDPPAALDGADAARARAVELLALRDKEGMWNGKEGSVVETSRALIELSRCDRALKQAQKKAPPQVAVLPEYSPADAAKTDKALVEGGKFLAGLAPDGKFGQPGKPDAGVTTLALGALLCVPEPRPPEVQKAIDSGLAWVLTLRKPDGSIHDGKLANYCTSGAILALVRANKSEYAPVIAAAQKSLQGMQADEGEGFSEGDLYYGGMGYGGDAERSDLSNLQMALEALSASGLKKGDPSYAKALLFLQHCQNRSESNNVRIAEGPGGKAVIVSGNDGGAGYAPGDSKAGFVELGDGTKVPRSYGSMTYALLKSFVFAGLDKKDPRVQAAWEWCRKNYTLDINPGFVVSEDPTAAYQGLFYYFHTMARALAVMGEDAIVDSAGKSHAWRNELSGRLIAMQDKATGSWLNKNSPRWYEGNPVVATAYALLTLDAARPK